MGYDSPDWHQPAIIASGRMQMLGGGLVDSFDRASGAAWASMAPTAGRSVIEWTIRNTGNGRLALGLGAEVEHMILEPGESWPVPFNGPIYYRTAGGAGANTALRAVAVEA